jgi:hypothetical protein
MRWYKAVSYIFSPLIGTLVFGTLLVSFDILGGTWFVIIVLVGLIVSIVNSVLVVTVLSKKDGNT